MGQLYLVRHGQASFGTHDYDRLSDLGHRQCRRLGEHFREAGIVFEAASGKPELALVEESCAAERAPVFACQSRSFRTSASSSTAGIRSSTRFSRSTGRST